MLTFPLRFIDCPHSPTYSRPIDSHTFFLLLSFPISLHLLFSCLFLAPPKNTPKLHSPSAQIFFAATINAPHPKHTLFSQKKRSPTRQKTPLNFPLKTTLSISESHCKRSLKRPPPQKSHLPPPSNAIPPKKTLSPENSAKKRPDVKSRRYRLLRFHTYHRAHGLQTRFYSRNSRARLTINTHAPHGSSLKIRTARANSIFTRARTARTHGSQTQFTH